jgi:hypothetical protein
MNARFATLVMTVLIGFVYLLVLTRGHLTMVPH